MSDSIFFIRMNRGSNETLPYVLWHSVVVIFQAPAKKPGFVVTVVSVLEVDDFQW